MREIAITASTACAAALLSSLLTVILPQGTTKRTAGTVTGVFVLCCMLIPIYNSIREIKFDFELNIPEAVTSSADEAYDDAVIKECESILQGSVDNYLVQNGIEKSECIVSLKKDDGNGIYIDGIRIYIYTEESINKASIIQKIKEKYGVTPVIKRL